jgi:hypothetical protein
MDADADSLPQDAVIVSFTDWQHFQRDIAATLGGSVFLDTRP